MMNIEPPGVTEWLLLIAVGSLAGAVNGLRSFATLDKAERMIVGAAEGSTALFVTITTFLVLHSVVPVVFGVVLPPLGLIGISGVVAHLGLRQTIRMVMRARDKEATD